MSKPFPRDSEDYVSHPGPEQCGLCEAPELPRRGLCQRCLDVLNGDLVEDEQQVTNVLTALCDAAELAARRAAEAYPIFDARGFPVDFERYAKGGRK